MILGITGHRELAGSIYPTPLAAAVQAKMREHILELKPEKARSGMALGTDLRFAWLCIQLDVPLIADCPWQGHEAGWPVEYQKHLREMLESASEVHHVSDPPVGRTQQERRVDAARKLQKRNEWLVDRVDTLLAVWTGKAGGTANCVRYAEKVGKRVVRVNLGAIDG